ncbi:zinc ribbon domain-containing protein [Brevibacillus borstelensis]|uniref:zinc ribbon domain-containing protein n=1 Tax=Brevibacillus borstelensis TaxID=45462 RepID=UPI0030BEC7EE
MRKQCNICKEKLDYNLQCGCTRQSGNSLYKKEGKLYGCPKCGGTSATVAEMSATGGTLSRVLNMQYQRFDVVSCNGCGYSEFYRKDASVSRDVIDLFFG